MEAVTDTAGRRLTRCGCGSLSGNGASSGLALLFQQMAQLRPESDRMLIGLEDLTKRRGQPLHICLGLRQMLAASRLA